MLRLDNDIKSLQGFANRAYSNEMSVQKTILRDLLGGKCLSPMYSIVTTMTPFPCRYPPHPNIIWNKSHS